MAIKDKVYFTPDNSPVAPDLFDVRVRTQYLSRGVITQDELTAYLSNLPDETENAEARLLEQVLGEETTEQGVNSGTTTH